jgi:hypothetical protein
VVAEDHDTTTGVASETWLGTCELALCLPALRPGSGHTIRPPAASIQATGHALRAHSFSLRSAGAGCFAARPSALAGRLDLGCHETRVKTRGGAFRPEASSGVSLPCLCVWAHARTRSGQTAYANSATGIGNCPAGVFSSPET